MKLPNGSSSLNNLPKNNKTIKLHYIIYKLNITVMKTKITLRETLIFLVSILPLFYLAYQWNNFPDTVPTHFNVKGEPDDYSSKKMLAVFVFSLSIGSYLFMLVIPKID